MRSRIAFFIIVCMAFCLSGGADAQQIVQTLRQTSLGNGFILIRGTISVGSEAFELTAVKYSENGHELRVVDTTQTTGNDTLLGIMNATKAKVVLSGGFLSAYSPPIPAGLVKQNGVLRNRISEDVLLNGLVTSGHGHVEIQRINVNACLSDCLQAGPLLVHDFQVYQPSIYANSQIEGHRRRAFIATLPHDYVVVGIAEDASLKSLAEFLGSSPDRNGLGCESAINLSGGASAGLAWDQGSQGSTIFSLANALVIH